MSKIDEILALAVSQIGTSNTSQYNCEYYKAKKDPGYPWCVVYQWWLFQHSEISDLFYGGGETASSNALYNYHKAQGQVVTDYQPGDLIFFDTTGACSSINHVGLCESYDGTTIVSIDGNTSGATGGSENNGGCVNRRARKAKKYVMAAIRPRYDQYEQTEYGKTEEVKYNTVEEVPEWGREAVQALISKGYLQGNDEGHLELTTTLLRMIVINYRAGLYQ